MSSPYQKIDLDELVSVRDIFNVYKDSHYSHKEGTLLGLKAMTLAKSNTNPILREMFFLLEDCRDYLMSMHRLKKTKRTTAFPLHLVTSINTLLDDKINISEEARANEHG